MKLGCEQKYDHYNIRFIQEFMIFTYKCCLNYSVVKGIEFRTKFILP